MELAVIWVVASVVVGVVARSRGRLGFAWFLLALVASPLLAGVAVLVLPRDGSHLPAGPGSPADLGNEQVSARTHGRCDECREVVRLDARKCKHCGAVLKPRQMSA